MDFLFYPKWSLMGIEVTLQCCIGWGVSFGTFLGVAGWMKLKIQLTSQEDKPTGRRPHRKTILHKTTGRQLYPDLEIVVYPGILVPRIYLSQQNIFKQFSVLGPLFNISLSIFNFLQIFFDISADLTVNSADMPIFSAKFS